MTREQKLDLVEYRMSNSEKTLVEVEVLLQNKLWNIAVNRLYYACFYAVSALLVYNDISTKTHAGARQMLGLHFIDTEMMNKENGRFYSKIFTMRHKGDYEDFIDYAESDVTELILPAKTFINQVQELLSRQ